MHSLWNGLTSKFILIKNTNNLILLANQTKNIYLINNTFVLKKITDETLWNQLNLKKVSYENKKILKISIIILN